ncbi:MAG TPA: CaiB/BaiF CoA-transferase family protein, partial [Trebonia sp.]|nr:CaiB/BaiF CoA-transferase family protein [Trebonia sp.]
RGQSSYFVWLNRGKESVELDVKDPADRALLGAIIDRADVFVQNLIPGAARRLGLDAETLRAGHPSLIHCSISGYGESGPYASKKAYDLLVQCEAGLVMSTGTPETPSKAGFSVADLSTGMFAFSGILTALYDRERTGAGATLRVSLLDALGELMTQPAYFSRYGGEPPRRTGARHPSISPYGPFKVCDGSVFFGIQNEREWLILCRDVLHRGDLAADPRFASNPARVTHNDELTAIIEESFLTRSADQVSDALESAGIASARLRAPADLADHPQLRARDRWRTVGTPGGEIEALLPPVEVAGSDPVMGPVPALGEHTAAVRMEFGKDLPA